MITPVQVSAPASYSDLDVVSAWNRFHDQDTLGDGAPRGTLEMLTYHTLSTQLRKRGLDPRAAARGEIIYTLSSEEIEEVLRAVAPQVIEIVERPGSQWEEGPAGVGIIVENFWGDIHRHLYGNWGEPKPEWPDFWDLAENKGHVSLVECKPSEMCSTVPQIKDDHENRNYKGGDWFDDLGIGASGLTGDADKEAVGVVKTDLREAKIEKNRRLYRSANTCALP